jgi:hypothetical protein
MGDPESLLVGSTFLSALHPRQVPQSVGLGGAAGVRWGTFSVYGVKLHLLCATNRVPTFYELTPANMAEVSLSEELLAEANLGENLHRFGHQDRGQDHSLQLRFLHQSHVGPLSREDQRIMGLNLTTLI